MKKLLLTTLFLFSTLAHAGGSGGGGINAFREPTHVAMDTGEHFVWLNSLADYDGDAPLTDCHAATTFAGTPGGGSHGSPRTIYICRVQDQ